MQISTGIIRILSLLLFLLPADFYVSAQTLFQATLLDKTNNQGIPFATIKVLHKPYGTYTNEKGIFTIAALPSDTLLITCTGFEVKQITASGSDTFYLNPVAKELMPVVVHLKKIISTETLGISAKKSFRWGPSGAGEEFAQKIDLMTKDNEYVQIMRVILSATQFSSDKPVLLHIYSVHPVTGMPDKELLSKNYVIQKNNFKRRQIIVNLEAETVYVDEKEIFIAFEWLGYGKNMARMHSVSTMLNMTNEVAEPLTYSRTLAHSSYDWFPLYKTNGEINNTIFSIIVNRLE